MSKLKKSPWYLIWPTFWAWLAAVISMIGLFTPLQPALTQELRLTDKLIHLVMFGMLTVVFLVSYRRHRGLVLTELCAYAILSELLQRWFVYGRTADVFDGIANSLGILAGWWIVHREEATRP